MESLLSPPEAHVIQNFLASIDGPANDWALYSAGNPDNVADVPIPQAQGREALAKATKELMALDADRWQTNFTSHNYTHHHHPRRPHPQQHHHPYDFHRQQQQIHHQIGDHHHHHHASISHDPFPYMHPHKTSLYPLPLHQEPIQDTSQPVPNAQHLRPLTVPSSRADGHGLHSASPPTSTATSSAATTPSTTTPTPVYAFSSTSSVVNSAQPTSPRLTKQQISQQASPLSTPPAGPKQNLLSPSQKKANHIQSEQKRRANIRRGYDALCETVPALREAIREEEEREAEPKAGGSAKMNGKTLSSGKSKRGKKDDKSDGRAGPRSENVVLSKTIDYINELLSERQTLMNRLQHAREVLPPGHPVMMPSVEQPLWEREWKGGEGKYDAKAEADEDEEEEEEEESS